MSADYDRLFRPAEGAELPDAELPDEASAQTDFDVNAPSQMPPMPTTSRQPNGHVAPPMPVDIDDQPPPAQHDSPAPPMPVDWTKQSPSPHPPMPVDFGQQPPPAQPDSPAPPMPVESAEYFPPAPPEQPPADPAMPVDRPRQSPPAPIPVDQTDQFPPARPSMPVDLPEQPPSARPPTRPDHPTQPTQPTPVRSEPPRSEPPSPPAPQAQAPRQHARHARREQPDPAELQNGRTTGSQQRANTQHRRHATPENNRGRTETRPSNPPRIRTTSAPAPNGGPVPAPAFKQREPDVAPAGTAHAPAQSAAQSPATPNGAPLPDPASSPAVAGHGEKGAVTHVGVKPAKKSATKMVSGKGWRRWVHKLTRINLGLSRDEKYELDLRGRIRRTPRGSYQIGVLGLKGGVGKTTVTVSLGSVLAQVRRDRILAFDADAASGDLAQRVGRQSAASVADLLTDDDLSHYNDVRAHTSVNSVNLEVLAAEEYSTAQRAFSEADWHYAADAVSRFYNLVLADCGPGLFDPVTRGVLATVSGIVIVTSASIDGARQAAVAIDWLCNNGYQELLSRACVVINHTGPGGTNIVVADLVRQFEQYVQPGRVVVLPWDKHIADGSEIEIRRLDPVYKRRVTELAAALSDDFDRGERR